VLLLKNLFGLLKSMSLGSFFSVIHAGGPTHRHRQCGLARASTLAASPAALPPEGALKRRRAAAQFDAV
jgi:hypothetical protein